jgi:sulfur carrier protein
MKVVVNGNSIDVPEHLNVREILTYLGYEAPSLAVAVNRNCIPRREFESTSILENDQIEILSPAQGG